MTPQTAAQINKGLAALAIAAFAAAALTLFPSFGPSTEANAAPMFSKGDRLNIATVAPLACAEQNWPNFNASCLRTPSNSSIKVRLVTTDKL